MARPDAADLIEQAENLSVRVTGHPVPAGGSALVRRVGAVCWAVIGVVLVLGLAVAALATISEVVLPLVFGVVLAVVFTPARNRLRRRGWPPALASLAIVLALVVLCAGAVLLAASAVTGQAAEWSRNLDGAVEEVASTSEDAGVDEDDLQDTREAFAGAAAFIAQGFLTAVVGGVGTVIGFLAGAVLAVLILYYVLKDSATVRAQVVSWFPASAQAETDAFLTRSAKTIRSYGAARTVLSTAVALVITAWSALLGLPMLLTIAVVNFLGGYIPYLGAIIGGAVPVVLALSELGVGAAVATLVVLLLANLAFENLVEPKVMGNRLDVHPLVVLVVTTAGGIVGGIVGLILAVPLFVVTRDGVATFRRHIAP